MVLKKALISLGFIALVVFFGIAATANVRAADEAATFSKISDAYKSGRIGYTDMLFEQMKAVFSPDQLATEYKSTAPSVLKSGTDLILQVRDHWDQFSPDQQSLLTSYLTGPSLAKTLETEGGFFRVHYDTSGAEAVPAQDIDGDNIPDYVERIAGYLDSARETYITHLGYMPPPVDSDTGEVAKYNVYLVSISAYGMTVPDGPGDSVWNDYKSYIYIHHDFNMPLFENDDPEGDAIGAQKVTAAHEFYHAVQLGYKYDPTQYLWIMEASSMWMEEVNFPEVNDNQNFLHYFFDHPEYGLTSTLGYHHYGTFIWPAYLHQKYDIDILRHFWEAARYNSSLAAFDSALAAYGSSLMREMPEFTVWNFFTGSRAVPGEYYEEAADYPMVAIARSFDAVEYDSIVPVRGPDGLACNYLAFEFDSSNAGILEIMLDGTDLARWANSSIIPPFESAAVNSKSSSGTERIYLYIPFIEDHSSFYLIPAVISKYLEANAYFISTSVLPYGDANYDRNVNVGDATYLINYVFAGGLPPKPLMESGDANCDGGVNVADAVLIIQYVFNGGLAPCTDRQSQ